MTNRQDAARLVKEGVPPRDVAKHIGKPMIQVRTYLLQQISEHELLATEIIRSLGDETRGAYESYTQASDTTGFWELVNGSEAQGFDRDEFILYLLCRDSLRRDLYVCISDLEVFLHEKVRSALVSEFGSGESEWWRLGIPEQIRVACVSMRETDPYPPGEPYVYTTFIHLWKIIEANWQRFFFVLPSNVAADKRALSQMFSRLNAIRNAVMHPVKRLGFADEDFLFVREALESLGDARRWRG